MSKLKKPQDTDGLSKLFLKKALPLIKEKKGKFFRVALENIHKEAICLDYREGKFTSAWILMDLKPYLKDNPAFAVELRAIGRATLAVMPPTVEFIPLESLKRIHEKYMSRVYALEAKKAKGFYKFENKTRAIKEFLERGFVHESEVPYNPNVECIIKCNIAPLRWPKTFKYQHEALEVMHRMGIQGYTGTTILKK